MRLRRAAWVPAVLVLAVVGVVVLARDGGRPAAGSCLRVLFTGETLGALEPCNCSGKMAGGLPVRGGYLKRQSGEFLLLDVGCIGSGARDFEVLRAEAALRGMKHMGYDAANIGEHELWLGRELLNRLIGVGVPFVSANTLDENGLPVVPQYLLLKRSGLSIAVTGLVESGRYETGPGLDVCPPREALGRLIPKLRRQAGLIVVLADLDLDAVRELARDFPEITLILFRGRGDSHAPELVNRTIIASVYGEARYVGDVTLTWQSERRLSATGEVVLLDERFAPSLEVIAACITWYKAAVHEQAFDLTQERPGWERIQPRQAEAGNRYVGSETCRSCHPYQHQRWKIQRHARAMESLRKAGYDWSPECIVCHTVGYGSADGYRTMKETPRFGRVGCEVCHGRGYILRHGNCNRLARRADARTCRQCHTMAKHPTFDYAKQWNIIGHKEKK